MAASALVNKVYKEHLRYYGKHDESFVYTTSETQQNWPDRIDVFVWYADAECDMTTFATIGMSDQAMSGCQHRAELHFSIRDKLNRQQAENVAQFMTNLAMHPFRSNSHFDWWHSIAKPGAVPLYRSAQSVWLYPAFVEEGWQCIDTDTDEVRLLNIVPITAEELAISDTIERAELISGIDIFTPR